MAANIKLRIAYFNRNALEQTAQQNMVLKKNEFLEHVSNRILFYIKVRMAPLQPKKISLSNPTDVNQEIHICAYSLNNINQKKYQ